jgi:YD repeat-containing protein
VGDLDVDANLLISDSDEAAGHRQLDATDFGKAELAALQAATGATSDASSANTTIGLLKALKALMADPASQTTLAAVLAKIPGADVPQLVATEDGVPLSVNGVPETISATTYDADGNLTAWTQNGVAYEATYDANGNLLTQGPAS